jgi:hypothetical protein
MRTFLIMGHANVLVDLESFQANGALCGTGWLQLFRRTSNLLVIAGNNDTTVNRHRPIVVSCWFIRIIGVRSGFLYQLIGPVQRHDLRFQNIRDQSFSIAQRKCA